MPVTPEQREEQLAAIRAAAANKPAHLQFIERLVAHYSNYGKLDDEPSGQDIHGLSYKAEWAIAADIAPLYNARHAGAYGRQYTTMRRNAQIAASRATRTREQARARNPLSDLLRLDTPED